MIPYLLRFGRGFAWLPASFRRYYCKNGSLEGHMPHIATFRIYYEDTDLAGIVYYANYFKFIERARTDWVRELGIDQTRLKEDAGLVFAVARVEADFKVPAKFDDMVTVETRLDRMTGARLVLDQKISRNGTLLFDSIVTLVCLTSDGRPAKIPAEIRSLFTP